MATHSVVVAGLGGQGVLTVGQLLGYAGLSVYRYASYFPSYMTFMRGASCECTLVLSDEEILSPVIDDTEAAVVLDPSQLPEVAARLQQGGLLVIEEARLKGKVARDDLTVIPIPGEEVARGLGDGLAANFVLLGAYVAASGVVPPEALRAELERRYQASKQMLELNGRAFAEGVRLGTAAIAPRHP